MSDEEELFDDVAKDDDEDQEEGDAKPAAEEASAGEEGSGDSSEEEEEGQDEYEKDDFIVDEEEEAEQPGSEDEVRESRRKKRKKKREKELIPDEDDYALLEENDSSFKRPQRKRIKAREEKPQTREEMAAFFADEGADGIEDDVEDLGGEGMQEEEEEYGDDYEEGGEMDDFIVDGDGQQRRRQRRAMPGGIAADAFEEAVDIFGNVDLLLQEYESKKAERQAEASGVGADYQVQSEAEDEDYDGSDEEAMLATQQRKDDAARQRRLKKALEVLDPEMVARKHLLPQDQTIADKDVPERFQLLGRLMEEDLDYDAATEWIYKQLLSRDAPDRREKLILEDGCCEVDDPQHSDNRELVVPDNMRERGYQPDLRGRRGVKSKRTKNQRDSWRDDDLAQKAVRECVLGVLRLIHEKHYEVPFIALYRKEVCGELLSGREQDMPKITEKEELGPKGAPLYPPGVVQAKHRRIRCWHLLWGVYEWSLKFKQLARRKEARRRVYEAAMEKLEQDRYEEQARAVEGCISALLEAESMEAVADVEQKFQLVMDALPGPDAQLMRMSLSETGSKSAAKRHSRGSNKYARWKQLRIGEFLNSWTLSAGQFADCLENEFKQHEAEDPRLEPEVLAATFVEEDELPTAQDVLKAARLLAATELVAEPTVRHCIRERYQRYVQVTSEPTDTGERTIDPIHKYGTVKRLRGKPLSMFTGDQFLRLACAERESLLKITITVPDMDEKLMYELNELYESGNVSKVASEWNEQRRMILQEAAVNRLFPIFERETRTKLLMEAKENALHQYADNLWALASRPPLYLRVFLDAAGKHETIMLPRIMAVCYGNGEPQPSTVVMLDPFGSLLDILHCHTLSGNIPRTGGRGSATTNVFKDERKQRDVERLHMLIKKHKPNVVVVGCSAPQCRTLKSDIDSIRDHILENEPWELQDLENSTIDVRFADESVARLWEDCQSAKEEFPEHDKHIRRAIALGRVHIDPLAMLSSLCDPKRAEILSLKLYDLQDQLSREDLMRKIEQVMVTAVCQVGVDLTLMAELPWRARVLQFVPGLGPRKAEPLLKYVQRALNRRDDDDNEIGLSRGDLLVESGVFQRQVAVYQNCAAFLRIRSADLPSLVNVLFRPTDDSRIHPAALETVAQTIAEAVDEEDADAAMRVPAKVARLQHHALADLAMQHFDGRMATAMDIVFEFLAPYGEWRPPILPLKEQEVFMLLHGETEETLAPGKLVEARVMRVFREEVRCMLTHSGAEAVIKKENFSASADHFNLDMRSRVKQNDVVVARVLKVCQEGGEEGGNDRGGRFDERKWVVQLTTRSDDLNNLEKYERQLQATDQYYHILTAEEKKRDEEEERNTRKFQKTKNFIERPIKHPFFANVSISEAVNKLGQEPVGSFLFRPNVRGLGSISLSVCLHKGKMGGVFVHYDLKEAPRPPGARGPQLRALSTPLTVEIAGQGVESYDDLDEVCARFVEALMNNVRQLIEHKKFRDGSRHDIEEALKEEKAALSRSGQNGAVYCLGIDEQKPGAFYIAFITNQSVHRDHVLITPAGFYFRKRTFHHVDKMINEFKRNPHNPHKEAMQAQQAQYGYSSYGRSGGPPPGGACGPPGHGMGPGPGGYPSRQPYVGYNPNQGPGPRNPYGHAPPGNSYNPYGPARPPPPGVPPPSVR